MGKKEVCMSDSKQLLRISKIPLPTPFPVGRINSYFIENSPATLIDAGINSERSLENLEQELAKTDHKIEDVRRILITHFHLDHAGAAVELARRSGAQVYLSSRGLYYLQHMKEKDRPAWEFFLRCGAPREDLETLEKMWRGGEFFGWQGKAPQEIEILQDRDIIDFEDGTELQALHTPGHSPDHFSFFDHAGGNFFSGDLLLAKITPNPGVYFDPENNDRRTRSLINYINSLRKIKKLNAHLTLPGHGDNIEDTNSLIDKNLSFIDQRQHKLLALVKELDRPTVYELATAHFKGLDLMNTLLAVSETVAHLDLLKRDGQVNMINGDPVRVGLKQN
jgi:glyoxylase-like metal-dependent hydrolase (beta-lactamase superfamily II)